MLGVDTLIIDRNQRIGDNWRNRYHQRKCLKSHTLNFLLKRVDTDCLLASCSPRPDMVRPHALYQLPTSLANLHPQRQTCRLLRVVRSAARAERLDVDHNQGLVLGCIKGSLDRSSGAAKGVRCGRNSSPTSKAYHPSNGPFGGKEFPVSYPWNIRFQGRSTLSFFRVLGCQDGWKGQECHCRWVLQLWT